MTARARDAAGEWTDVTASKTSWRTRLACFFQTHDEIFRMHVHKIRDMKWCLRCRRFWTRDGCAVRQCGAEGGRGV